MKKQTYCALCGTLMGYVDWKTKPEDFIVVDGNRCKARVVTVHGPEVAACGIPFILNSIRCKLPGVRFHRWHRDTGYDRYKLMIGHESFDAIEDLKPIPEYKIIITGREKKWIEARGEALLKVKDEDLAADFKAWKENKTPNE